MIYLLLLIAPLNSLAMCWLITRRAHWIVTIGGLSNGHHECVPARWPFKESPHA